MNPALSAPDVLLPVAAAGEPGDRILRRARPAHREHDIGSCGDESDPEANQLFFWSLQERSLARQARQANWTLC